MRHAHTQEKKNDSYVPPFVGHQASTPVFTTAMWLLYRRLYRMNSIQFDFELYYRRI